ncbi:hypothetical protein [Jatrophihabitans sp.]|uniref:hypothetical protein n=1 Tax=Jatrophihabitans sp. TaxID=1932789 RepID=UPI002CA1C395|nr:hypothetical protein [Jatrophihabitans sp.]
MARTRSQTPRKEAKPAVRALTSSPARRASERAVPAPESGTPGASEVWQARIGRDLAEQLRADAEVLGLDGRTEIVRAALGLLHRQAAEERMARSVEEFYGDSTPPLPLGVEPADDGA